MPARVQAGRRDCRCTDVSLMSISRGVAFAAKNMRFAVYFGHPILSATSCPLSECRITGSLTHDAEVSVAHRSVREAAEPLLIVRSELPERDSAEGPSQARA